MKFYLNFVSHKNTSTLQVLFFVFKTIRTVTYVQKRPSTKGFMWKFSQTKNCKVV